MCKFLHVFLGVLATLVYQVFGETNSPKVRKLISFRPETEVMAEIPLFVQHHVATACLLFAPWPFIRLVHVFSAPIPYFFHPFIV